MKIRKCTCGGTAKIPDSVYEDGELRYVQCLSCGKETLLWADGRKAIRNWNAMIKKELNLIELKNRGMM